MRDRSITRIVWPLTMNLVHEISTHLSIIGRMYCTPHTPASLQQAYVQHVQISRFFRSRECVQLLQGTITAHAYSQVDLVIRNYIVLLRTINAPPPRHRYSDKQSQPHLSQIILNSLLRLKICLCAYLDRAPPTESAFNMV